MVCVHCPRCSLNLAGLAPPGHRLLCWRKEPGSTEGTILGECPKEVVAISYAGVRRRKIMLRLRPTRWSRSCQEDKPLERVHQDEQALELAQSGRKQNSNCQVLFEPAR